ncbi:hypothetical protein [Legionella donaldsonii]|uniref:hypothetical protein n=1 Tax=Legionella donaldsonii TaxID=45060 RepID=UPI00399CC91B
MGTTKVSSGNKPLLSKRKAVRNLKELASSSTGSVNLEASTSAFFPKEQTPHQDPFLYENLQDNIGKKIDNYFLYSLESYIYFKCSPDCNNEKNKLAVAAKRSIFAGQRVETGWKLHISVDPGQISAAWAIIYPILMENKMSAKILAPDVLKSKPIEKVSGKQFTIYQFQHKHINTDAWIDIMQRIENELREHGIAKGVTPTANKQIPNSEYFSYRNDAGPGGRYISDTKAQQFVELHQHEDPPLLAYNLANTNDPFTEVVLQSPLDHNQIDNELKPT